MSTRTRVRIEICGGIAAGKTTLAHLIADAGHLGIFEDFQAVPFWKAFYAAPGSHAFETEISFLLQHYHQIKIDSGQNGPIVCDFSFLMDEAYAVMGLQGAKLAAFMGVYREVRSELGQPDLLIQLKCSEDVELERIRLRGRRTEEKIDPGFLRALTSTLDHLVLEQSQCPVLRIESDREDFTPDGSAREDVLRRVLGFQGGLH